MAKDVMHARFGTILRQATVRKQVFHVGDTIRRRDDHSRVATADFFFWYGEMTGVVLRQEGGYDFDKPIGLQEEFLYLWEVVPRVHAEESS